MAVAVLGNATIDGQPVRSRRQAQLLAALALDLGESVPADRLVERIWIDDLPDDPAAALHTLVSRLRAALPTSVRIVSTPTGYRLEADPGAIDLHDLAAWERRGPELAPADRLEAALATLARFRGVPFADLDTVDALAAREQSEEIRRRLLEAVAESLLALGRPEEAVDVVRPLAAEHQTRESAVAILMTASYQAGRQTDALAAASRLRDVLREDFGLEPTPRIAALELAILEHRLDPAPDPAPPAPTRPHRPASSFVGRSEDVAGIEALLGIARLVSIVGPGGIGKTRLAIEVIADLPASIGVAVAEFAEVTTAAEVCAVVAAAVGAAVPTGTDPVRATAQHLQDRQCLLVLDNCEHVPSATHDLAAELLGACPHLRILATSRAPLGVDGEHRWPLAPLTSDAAVELFLDRARAADGRGPGPGEAVTVAGICARLDGLPLSIELAAAALATVSLSEVAAGLDRSGASLQDRRPTTPDRHRDLRAVVDWSYRLLDADERDAFTRLGVFTGSFDLADVAGVFGPHTVDQLPRLVERSLVVRVPESSPARFELLEPLRVFARDLRGPALADDRRAHASWAVRLANDAHRSLAGPDEVATFRHLRDSLATFRQAHDWLTTTGAGPERVALVGALVMWGWQCDETEVLEWAAGLERVLDEPSICGDADAVATTLAAVTVAASRSGDLATAWNYAQAAVRAAEAASPGPAALAYFAAAEVALFDDHDDEALDFGARAAGLDPPGVPTITGFFGAVDAALGAVYRWDPVAFEAWISRATTAAETLDSPLAHAWVEFCHAERASTTDPARAALHLERVLLTADPTTSTFLIGVAELLRAQLATTHGDADTDLSPFAPVLERWRAAGAWTQVLMVLRTMVAALVGRQRLAEAAVLLGVLLAAAPVPGWWQERLTLIRRQLVGGLGPGAFDAALAEGRSLTLDAAVDRAITFTYQTLDPGGTDAP